MKKQHILSTVGIVTIGVVLVFFAVRFQTVKSPEALFKDFIGLNSNGVERIEVSYVPGREWRIAFFIKARAQFVLSVIAHEHLMEISEGTPQNATFWQYVFRRFGLNNLPGPERFKSFRVFEAYDHPQGTSAHLIWNEETEETFLLKERY